MSDAKRQVRHAPLSKPASATLRRIVPLLVPVFCFSLVVNLLRLTVPLYMLQVIDRVLSSESSETLLFLTILAGGALLVGALLSAVMGSVMSAAGAWFDENVYPRLIARSMQARAQVSPRRVAGSLRDVGQLRQLMSGQSLTTLFEVPWTFVFLGVLFYLHPNLGMLASVAAVILLSVATLDELLVQPLRRDAQKEKEIAGQSVEDAVLGLDATKAMGFQDRLAAVLGRGNAQTSAKLDRATRRGSLVHNTTRLLRTGAQIAVLGTGALLVLEAEITTGTMIAGSILLGLALAPVDKAVGVIASVKGFVLALRRLNAQLATYQAEAGAGEAKLPETGYTVSLRQATVMPEGLRRPVLRPLSFDVEAGEILGVIGPVGAGKTTLCRLLAGVTEPSAGTVLLNEVPLARLTATSVRRHFGYLPQNGTALPGTIADNISRFDDGAPDAVVEKVNAAAKAAGVHNAILSLPDAYDTRLDAQGSPFLSRGQLQQILIARALYDAPKYLVLDEPASWLDKAGEGALIESLRNAHEAGATIVVVSQRPTLLNLCDRLLHLRNGHVVDLGTRPEVLERVSAGDVAGQPRRVRPQRGDQGARGAS